jgi:hypothetical protein
MELLPMALMGESLYKNEWRITFNWKISMGKSTRNGFDCSLPCLITGRLLRSG